MMTDENMSEALGLLADRCATLNFLATALQAEPTAAFLEPLLGELAGQPLDDTASQGQALLARFAAEAGKSSLDEVTAGLRAEYVSMFFASWRRVLSPFESVYRSEGHSMLQEPSQEMARRLAAAGLEPQEGFAEPPDHVSLELAYAAYLCEQSLAAAGRDDTVSAQGWLALQSAFLEDHLLPWVPRFCRDLDAKTDSLFYKGIAWLTLEFLDADAELLAEISAGLGAAAGRPGAAAGGPGADAGGPGADA
jgi:putative dimethyl sulfoxide reductase chaperone